MKALLVTPLPWGATCGQSFVASFEPAEPARLLPFDAAVLDVQSRNDPAYSLPPSTPQPGFDFSFLPATTSDHVEGISWAAENAHRQPECVLQEAEKSSCPVFFKAFELFETSTRRFHARVCKVKTA